MKLLDVTLPIEIHNKNDGQGNHWAGTHRTRKRMVKDLRMLGMVRKPFNRPVSVLATRILGKGQKLWDSSSILRGTYKQLEDSLVECGWFHDDDTKHITNTFGLQDVTRRHIGPAIRIQVFTEEIPPCRTEKSSASRPDTPASPSVSTK